MKACIINIGDELLIGQVINTNSSWMASQLNLAGIDVVHIECVADRQESILAALKRNSAIAQLILITGGLGPTKDDITKKTMSRFFGSPLVVNEQVLKDVISFFTDRGLEVSEVNRQQAEVPDKATVFQNKLGTAPGMLIKNEKSIYVSLPGVPHEMKELMTAHVIPWVKREFQLPNILHKTVLTQGIGESALAGIIAGWEEDLEKNHIRLAYLPQPGLVRLRLSAIAQKETGLEKLFSEKISELKQLIPAYFIAEANFGEELTLQEVVSRKLREMKASLSIAESCTGGHLSSLFVSIPGASDIFRGSAVVYHDEIKSGVLGVDPEIIKKEGAVSKECVEMLAKNALKIFGSDYSISVSGIAGPSGGSEQKPVGLVWVAVAGNNKLVSKKFRFGTDRQRNIVMAAQSALHFLLRFLKGIS
jgi:nicotinamide-nucleotide amidase